MPPNNQERGPVMDIQRPSSIGGSPPQKDPTIIPPANSLGRPATMEYTRPRPNDSFTNGASATQTQQQPVNNSPFQAAPKPKKSHKAIWVSLMLLVVVAVVGAGTYYYFMVMNNEAPAPVAPTVPQAKTEDTPTVQATPEGVDAATDAIDKSLNSLDDTADYSPDQVSDDSLGL